MSYTPLRYKRFTGDGGVLGGQRANLACVLVESGAAACTVNIRDGTLVTDAIIMTLKVDVANTSRMFSIAGLVTLQTDAYVDLDANTSSVTVFYG